MKKYIVLLLHSLLFVQNVLCMERQMVNDNSKTIPTPPPPPPRSVLYEDTAVDKSKQDDSLERRIKQRRILLAADDEKCEKRCNICRSDQDVSIQCQSCSKCHVCKGCFDVLEKQDCPLCGAHLDKSITSEQPEDAKKTSPTQAHRNTSLAAPEKIEQNNRKQEFEDKRAKIAALQLVGPLGKLSPAAYKSAPSRPRPLPKTPSVSPQNPIIPAHPVVAPESPIQNSTKSPGPENGTSNGYPPLKVEEENGMKNSDNSSQQDTDAKEIASIHLALQLSASTPLTDDDIECCFCLETILPGNQKVTICCKNYLCPGCFENEKKIQAQNEKHPCLICKNITEPEQNRAKSPKPNLIESARKAQLESQEQKKLEEAALKAKADAEEQDRMLALSLQEEHQSADEIMRKSKNDAEEQDRILALSLQEEEHQSAEEIAQKLKNDAEERDRVLALSLQDEEHQRAEEIIRKSKNDAEERDRTLALSLNAEEKEKMEEISKLRSTINSLEVQLGVIKKNIAQAKNPHQKIALLGQQRTKNAELEAIRKQLINLLAL